MNNVIRLATGPMSHSETAVLDAINPAGNDLTSLPGLTGLTGEEIDDALAQLIRRGFAQRTTRRVHRTGEGRDPAPRRLYLIHGDSPDADTPPPVAAA